ncbi:MAG: lactonase family protein [Streptococcaceae bacterium]|jgi:6-phosphogluconolactonase|nr:lactonase family protein [Streptococcaceae bacterium]
MEKENFLVSGYTKRASKGIYRVAFENGVLSGLTELAEISGPTYVTTDKAGHIYAVAADDAGNGGTAAFTADGQLINESLAPGASNCYVSVDEARQLVYAANYHEGEVRVYKILENGALALSDTVKHAADTVGPKPEQKGALCHFAALTPDKKLAVCDLGNDSIFVYDVAADGKLTAYSRYQSASGSGSRHLAFATDGTRAYLACELDSTVEVLSYEKGRFALLQKISTLPTDYDAFNGVAAIRLSTDNRFLYVSNRGHDSIAVFSVSADKISRVEIVKTQGHIPRDFNFNKTQDYLIVAHQESDNLSVLKRNKETGRLALVSSDFQAPEITCIHPI